MGDETKVTNLNGLKQSCGKCALKWLSIMILFPALVCAANPRIYEPRATEIVKVEGLPALGKWMIAPDYSPAHWLGALYENKNIQEPINIIIADEIAKTAEEAQSRLLAAATLAGFPVRKGHSSGYFAWINNALYSQFPSTPSHAFSDEPFELNNNHGRIFGPYSEKGRFLFVGALSRERVAPFSNPRHQYVSFNQARDKFADAFNLKTCFKIVCFVGLDNALISDSSRTTGDHDGQAVLLRAPKTDY
jgi:hypothetical protein